MNVNVAVFGHCAKLVNKVFLPVVIVFSLYAFHEAVNKHVSDAQFNCAILDHAKHRIWPRGPGLIVQPQPPFCPVSKIIVKAVKYIQATTPLVLLRKWIGGGKHPHHAPNCGYRLHFKAGNADFFILTDQTDGDLSGHVGFAVPVLTSPDCDLTTAKLKRCIALGPWQVSPLGFGVAAKSVFCVLHKIRRWLYLGLCIRVFQVCRKVNRVIKKLSHFHPLFCKFRSSRIDRMQSCRFARGTRPRSLPQTILPWQTMLLRGLPCWR